MKPITTTPAASANHSPLPWSAFGTHCIHKDGELIVEMLRGQTRQNPIQSNRDFVLLAVNSRARLEAENVALRKALRDAASHIETYDQTQSTRTAYNRVMNKARALLASLGA